MKERININFKVIYLQDNKGHGEARRTSLDYCSNEIIALMDADDISLPIRFEKEIEALNEDTTLDIVGGQITEFVGGKDNIIGMRKVPLTDSEIKKYLKKRCPMNQVTVMFRKKSVAKVGGYIDWFCEEDYYLWIRMYEQGMKFKNVDEVLVNVRTGELMSARRGGLKYFLSESRLQSYMHKRRIISLPRLIYNVALRFAGEVLVTNQVRAKLFKFYREKYTLDKKEALTIGEITYADFSVAMCVYNGDNAEWFDESINSIVEQTVRPKEIVLVVDGPIDRPIQTVIDKYTSMANSCERILVG